MATPIDAEVKGPSESPSSLHSVSFTTLVWRDPANPDNKGECVFEPVVRHPSTSKSMGPPIRFTRRVSGRAKKQATTTTEGVLGSLSDDDVEEVHPDPLTLLAQAIPAHLAIEAKASLELQPEAEPSDGETQFAFSDAADFVRPLLTCFSVRRRRFTRHASEPCL